MLILTRKAGEAFYIGDDIAVTVEGIKGDKIKISINAPKDIPILRKELKDAQSVNTESVSPDAASIEKLIKGNQQ